MSTEAVLDRYRDLDAWPLERSLEALVAAHRAAAEVVERALPALERAAGGIEARLARGGRLIYAGAGTSGRLALQDAAELPPTFGFDRTRVLMAGGAEAGSAAREGAEDDRVDGRAAVAAAGVGPDDALIGIAASGRTPYTVAAVEEGATRGAFTVGIANNPDTPLLAVADAPLLLDTGPEVLAGSTRMAAGTAQKIALNALSTAALVRLGGAYRNLMVGMVPTNRKLEGRAIAIVQDATGASAEAARTALEQSAGIREAIVVLKTDLDPSAAGALLTEHGQRVRSALAAARGGER
jgi:N-acetylmuramic acid 6-phosphate etherase